MKLYKCTHCNKIKKESEFHKSNRTNRRKKVRSDCKVCHAKYRKIFLATEGGFMKKLFYSIQERCRKAQRTSRIFKTDFTKEEFLQMWEDHKKKYGMKCVFTGVIMDFIKSPKQVRGNQVSVDRLDNDLDYTKNNIIFCSSKANFMKASVTIDMCRKIVALYEERQGIDKTQKMNTMKGYKPMSSYRTATYLK